MDRRQFLRASGIAGLAGGLGVAIASCRSGAGPTEPTQGSEASALPTFHDAGVATPDLVGSHEDSLPAFFAYPSDPTLLYDGPVVSDVSMTALTYSFSPVVPALNENEMWQNINATVGADIQIIYTPQADYASRFATTIAGGDVPDLVAIEPPVQELPAMLESIFADLTDHLSGDAVLDYPSLANIPTSAWRKTMVQGRIWGLPIPRPPVGAALFVRSDIFSDLGLPVQPADFAQFSDVLRELAGRGGSNFASAALLDFPRFLAGTLGVSNGWSQQDGTFTYWMETDEYEQALADTRGFVDDGLFHPDALASQNTQRNEWFTNGSVPTIIAGWGGWHSFVNWGRDIDGFGVDAVVPFSYDSSIAPRHSRAISGGFTAVRAADDERIRDILRVADWLAAPFGTQDYLTRKFGIEGETYTLEGSDPVSTERGANLRLVPFAYLIDTMGPIYQANDEAVVQARFDYQETVMSMIEADDTDGLYSATESAQGARLTTMLNDAVADILGRRADVSSWPETVAAWRDQGGNGIRDEYEQGWQEVQ